MTISEDSRLVGGGSASGRKGTNERPNQRTRKEERNTRQAYRGGGEYRKEGKVKKLRVSFPTAGWVDDDVDDVDDG